jgi:hypothetical protein
MRAALLQRNLRIVSEASRISVVSLFYGHVGCSEPIGRTCNEHPRRDFSALFGKDAAMALPDTGSRSGGGIYPDQIGTPPFSRNVAPSYP